MKKRVFILTAALFAALAEGLYAAGLRSPALIHLIAINIIAFFLMVLDKMAARMGRWRVPERVLFAASLLGGTPATYLAMRAVRHKTRDKTYRPMFFFSLVVQALLAWGAIWWWLRS